MLLNKIAQINPRPDHKTPTKIGYIDTSSSYEGKVLEIQELSSKFPSRAKRQVKEHDILISSVRPENLHNCYVLSKRSDLIASTGYIQIRVVNNQYNSRWLYYYLTTPKMVKYYDSIANSSQTTFPAFNSSVFENIDIPELSLEIQQHIVGTTSSLR